jgi:hypothetical protein
LARLEHEKARSCQADWVVRFNAEGSDGLLDRKAPGPTRKLNDAQLQALVDLVERGPFPAVDGGVRWCLKDLVAWIPGTQSGREHLAIHAGELAIKPNHLFLSADPRYPP